MLGLVSVAERVRGRPAEGHGRLGERQSGRARRHGHGGGSAPPVFVVPGFHGSLLCLSLLLPPDAVQETRNLDRLLSPLPIAATGEAGEGTDAAHRRTRIGIFCFFNKQGHADRYLEPLLDDVMRNIDDLVVVSNGPLTRQARDFFRGYTRLDHRPSQRRRGGVPARHDGGRLEKLEQYDEVICFNDTIMGPVCTPSLRCSGRWTRGMSISWGITAYHGEIAQR